MKILFVINSLDTGGAPRLVTDLACELSENENLEIGVLIYEKRETDNFYKKIQDNPRIKLYELTHGHPLGIANLLRARKICSRYDVVHANLFPSGYAVRIANLFASVPLIYTEHSTHNRRRNHKLFKPIERFVYSGFRNIAAVSEPVKQALGKWLGKESIEKKISVVDNGVNLEAYSDIVPEDRVQALFGRSGKPILMVSRFTEAKDHATAIKALRHIKDPEAFIAFAGDGGTMEEMRRLAHDLGVEHKVLFLGVRSDLRNLMASSRIGLQASKWEGFCLTAVEMMAAGLPVVASNVDCLKDIVEGVALMYEPGNEKGLAAQIDKLLADENLRNDMTKKGRRRAADYDISSTAQNYLNLYNKIP